jgi:uncharacterized DUF497 family protein
MRITYDPAKRARTLAERGLDFADAARNEAMVMQKEMAKYIR